VSSRRAPSAEEVDVLIELLERDLGEQRLESVKAMNTAKELLRPRELGCRESHSEGDEVFAERPL